MGVFDGVHLGHQFLLKQLTNLAKQHNWQSTVLTFNEHPANVLNPNQAVKLILDLESKIRLLKAQPINNLIVQPFTQDFANLTATEFVEQVLVEKLQISAILITPNFRFGKNRQGDAQKLISLAKKFSFKVFLARMYRHQRPNCQFQPNPTVISKRSPTKSRVVTWSSPKLSPINQSSFPIKTYTEQ